MTQFNSLEVRMGTLSGTSLSVLAQEPWNNLAETILLSIVGALVSFALSRYLQWLFNQKE